MNVPALKRRILQASLTLGCALLALSFIKRSAEQGLMNVTATLTKYLVLAWAVVAGDKWWVIMPVSVAVGGTFFYEYKLYPHELALLLCALALLPVIALKRKPFPDRAPLPLSCYGLLGLFAINWAVSVYAADFRDFGRVGSLTRPYLQGLWALLFGILFYRYGLLKPRLLLGLLYAAFLVRALLSVGAFFFADVVTNPKFGFAFMSETLGVHDLRQAGIQTVLLGFMFAKLAKGNIWKAVNYGIMGMAAILVALGGGRVSVVMVCVIPLIWGFIRKKWGLMTGISAVGLGLVIFINQNTHMLYKLPPTARRALSVLVAETSTSWVDWHISNQSSNYWHRYLAEMGWKRWTRNPATFLFGDRVKPFDEAYHAYSTSLETRAEIAAQLGSYESGLWSILGVLGAVGAGLYIALFRHFLGPVLSAVRKEGVRDAAHALGCLAIIQFALWSLFCWTAGGLPSYELMMAFFAHVACSDDLSRRADSMEHNPS